MVNLSGLQLSCKIDSWVVGWLGGEEDWKQIGILEVNYGVVYHCGRLTAHP